MNNSPLRKYFGQNYGRREDSLEARANAANPMIEYKGQPIFKDQYDALTVVAGQYAKMPEELTKVVLESGLVKKLDFRGLSIKTSDGALTIPKELISLQYLNCADNQLQSLALPKELTSLEVLCCEANHLYSLELPKELTSLYALDCSVNQLHSLELPKELTSLQVLDCHKNQLHCLDIPRELKSLNILHCDGNPSLPRDVLLELRSRGVLVYE